MYATLSPAIKGQMPALSVGGSVYSPQAAARMVVLNGQVLREGDKVSEGLTLESIGPKTSTLNWQGTRFQLPH
jgi:general secretion pathway protein B